MKRVRLATLLALAALVALSAVPAGAQEYPPDAATCAVETTTPVPGQTIALSCEGWAANTEVTITIFSTPRTLGTAAVDGNGNVSTTVTIPSDLSPGDHTLRISGINAQGQQQNVDIALTVQRPAPAVDPPVAVTGTDSWLGALLGVGLLGAGGGALFAARRRQARFQA